MSTESVLREEKKKPLTHEELRELGEKVFGDPLAIEQAVGKPTPFVLQYHLRGLWTESDRVALLDIFTRLQEGDSIEVDEVIELDFVKAQKEPEQEAIRQAVEKKNWKELFKRLWQTSEAEVLLKPIQAWQEEIQAVDEKRGDVTKIMNKYLDDTEPDITKLDLARVVNRGNAHSVAADTPVVIRRGGLVDTVSIASLFRSARKCGDLDDGHEIRRPREAVEIWGRAGFVPLEAVSRHPLGKSKAFEIRTKTGRIKVSGEHSLFSNDLFHGRRPIRVEELTLGQSIETVDFPPLPAVINLDPDLSWVWGLFAAEGSARVYKWSKRQQIKLGHYKYGLWKISNKNIDLLLRAQAILLRHGMETILVKRRRELFELIPRFNVGSWADIYSRLFYERVGGKRIKRVPQLVLNATRDAKLEFLRGYYAGDGRQGQPWEFYAFNTNSPVLAQGLLLLVSDLTGQPFTLRFRSEQPNIYDILLLTPQPGPENVSRRLARKDIVIEKRELSYPEAQPKEYYYDVATSDRSFMAGVGNILAHNSDFRIKHPTEDYLVGITSTSPRIVIQFLETGELVFPLRDRLLQNQLYDKIPAVKKARQPCIAEETLVICNQGLLPAGSIQPGIKVLSASGEFQEVVRVDRFIQKEEQYIVKPSYGLPIQVDGEHPFLVNDVDFRSQALLTKGERQKIKETLRPKWVMAKHLKPGMIVLFPKLKLAKLTYPGGGWRFAYRRGRLFGFFLGDGSREREGTRSKLSGLRSRVWRLHFNAQEQEKLKVYRDILLSEGIHSWTKRVGETITLYFRANEIHRQGVKGSSRNWWFERFYGENGEKQIPLEFLYADKTFIRGLIDGLVDSDGYEDDSRKYVITTSSSIANSLTLLLLRLGKIPAIRLRENTDVGARLKGKASGKLKKVFEISWAKQRKNKFFFDYGSHYGFRIAKIEPVNPKPLVNIVTQDHTFCLPFVATHNTAWFTLVTKEDPEFEAPPTAIGATAETGGLFLWKASGRLFFGISKDDYKEWFLFFDPPYQRLNGRWGFQLLPGRPEYEPKIPGAVWWMLNRVELSPLPYILYNERSMVEAKAKREGLKQMIYNASLLKNLASIPEGISILKKGLAELKIPELEEIPIDKEFQALEEKGFSRQQILFLQSKFNEWSAKGGRWER